MATENAPEFDLGPLSWVQGEIDQALARGLEGLAAFKAAPADTAPLKHARTHIHQAAGAIQMVGLDAVVAFTDEIERQLARLEQASQADVAPTIVAVDRACRKLRIFLDELVNGAPPVPLKLFPEYEVMQKLRGLQASAPTDLFYPDLTTRAPRISPRETIAASKLPSYLVKQRRMYQRGLLPWLRGESEAAKTMRDAIRGIEDVTAQSSLRTFWWTVGAFLEAVVANGLDAGFGVKQLAARIDLQIRRVSEGGAKVADRLRREALYYVAISAPVAPQIQAVQRAYKLGGLIPSDEVLSADVVRIQPLLREARDQLVGAKDSWLKAASGRAENIAKLKQTLTSVHTKAAEIKHGALMKLTAALVERLDKMPTSGVSEPVAMEYATALLLAESAFENYASLSPDFPKQVDIILARLDAARAGRPSSQSAPMLDDMSKRAQERVLLAQVGREIQANLRHMEQVLDAFFRDNSKRADLATLAKDTQQVRGALRVLGLDEADKLLALCQEQIERYATEDAPVSNDELELLAESLSGLGFYIEAVEQQRPDRDRLIAPLIAKRTGEAPVKPAQEIESVEDAVATLRAALPQLVEEARAAPADAAQREALKRKLTGLKEDADLIGDADLAGQVEAAIRDLDQGEVAALAATVEAIADTGAAPAPEVSEETQRLLATDAGQLDAELLDIYLTEAMEVLDAIAAGREALAGNRGDREALTTVRRQFHTLKGSGRMVGLTQLGDLAWEVERLHNRLLEEDRPVTSAVLDLIEVAEHNFRAWVGELRANGRVSADTGAFHAAVEAVDHELSGGAPPARSRPTVVTTEPPPMGSHVAPLAVVPVDPPAVAPTESALALAPVDSAPAIGSSGSPAEPAGTALPELELIELPELGFVGASAAPTVTSEDEPAGETIEVGVPPDESPRSHLRVVADNPSLSATPAVEPTARFAWTVADKRDSHERSPSRARPDEVPSIDAGHVAPGAAEDDATSVRPVGSAVDQYAIAPIDAIKAPAADAASDSQADPGATTGAPAALSGMPSEAPVADASAMPVDAIEAVEKHAASIETDPTPPTAEAHDPQSALAAANSGTGAQDRPATVQAVEHAESKGDASSEDEVTIGAVTLSASLWKILCDEADQHLETLNHELAVLQSDAEAAPSEAMVRASHTLCGIHRTGGFPLIAITAKSLEQTLIALQQRGAPVPASAQPVLARAIAGLGDFVARVKGRFEFLSVHTREGENVQAELDALRQEAIATEPAGDAETAAQQIALREEEGDAAQEAAEVRPAAVATVTPLHAAPISPALSAQVLAANQAQADAELQRLRDEVDDTVLPIFLEEAAELFPQAGEQLRAWRRSGDDSGPAQQLRRTLHTFKGSARMAGAMRLGELTHRMESRLMPGELLAKASDDLFEALENDLDHIAFVLDALREGRTNIPLPWLGEAPIVAAERHEDTLAQFASGAATDRPIVVPLAPLQAIPAHAAPMVARAAGEAAEADTGSRAMLRVRADTVDRLVNEAGEVAIARARIEGELRALKSNLLELTGSVIRLRSQVREIELQAETQIASHMTALQAAHEGFDPLELDRYTRFQELTRSLAEGINDVSTVQQSLLKNLDDADAALLAQARLSRDVQQRLFAIRTVPFGSLSERLYRILRATARELDKRANLEIHGAQTELDRSVLEKLVGPLEHLLRNALDHGIESREARLAAGKSETGELSLTVKQVGNEILIELADDGAGIDFTSVRARAIAIGAIATDATPSDQQLIELLFMPGFTTAAKVTQISGRGIGMDVVRTEIVELGGRVAVQTSPGKGTQFNLFLPLTLAVAQAVLVRAGGRLWALPAPMVEQVQQVKAAALFDFYVKRSVQWQGRTYPFHYLPRLLGDNTHDPETSRYNSVLLLRSGQGLAGIHVDEMVGNQEVVVKNIGPQLARVSGISGATVLGTGEIVLIINPVQLAQRADVQAFDPEAERSSLRETKMPAAPVKPARPHVMVVDDSLTVRKISTRLLTRAGFDVTTAKDGIDALQLIADHAPDVILLDIEMPRMDGFEFTKTLKKEARHAHIPIIMITSRTADKHRSRAAELGVDLYLGKPFQEEELLKHLRDMLSMPAVA